MSTAFRPAASTTSSVSWGAPGARLSMLAAGADSRLARAAAAPPLLAADSRPPRAARAAAARWIARGAARLPPEVNRVLYVRNLPFKTEEMLSTEEIYDIFGKRVSRALAPRAPGFSARPVSAAARAVGHDHGLGRGDVEVREIRSISVEATSCFMTPAP
ncbi:hypothetical protein JL720_11757 [Aureococcus anophagefferens]|nr:hypothetical protein JL720_11757 [Aureococcus anophagefferens]